MKSIFCKYFFTLLFVVANTIAYANMAKPYVDGTESSTLFGSKNCKVTNEKIFLTAVGPVNDDDYAYKINYKISYQISADQPGLLPLLFIAQNMDKPIAVIVNGKKILLKNPNKNTVTQFKFLSPSQSGGNFYNVTFDNRQVKWGVSLNDLIYFEALLSKGENVVTVEYDGHPEYNVYGLLREYKIQYALYPSNYWKFFGQIEINIKLPKATKIRNVNIGKLENLKNGNYKLIIDKVTEDDLQLIFSRKISILAEVLLFIQPIGLAIIALLIAIFLHVKWVKKIRIRRQFKFNYAVPLGAVLVTLIFYAVFVYGNELILWATQDKGLKGGYFLLFVFTAPFFWLIYWIVMWIVDYQIKKRINSLNSNLN